MSRTIATPVEEKRVPARYSLRGIRERTMAGFLTSEEES
jgi:hypothetical protein